MKLIVLIGTAFCAPTPGAEPALSIRVMSSTLSGQNCAIV